MTIHTFNTRIYYEDTDALGIVYHANYLKFAERARTEWLRTLGFLNSTMINEDFSFIVHHIEIDFKAPARLDDLLTIKTEVVERKKVILKMRQTITNNELIIAKLSVSLACINSLGKPTGLPLKLIEAFKKFDP